METNNIEELARIASGLKLTDDYEAALAAQPENVRSSTRMQKIIAFLKDKESATLKDIAVALYGREDTASVNQLVKALKNAGIIADTGLVAPKAEKTPVNAPGVKGRPKVTNDEIKMLGGGALRKFAKGQSDFTPEEIDFITQLYNAATAVTEEEIAEVAKEEINENKKSNIKQLTEARFQFLAGVINENEFKQLKEATVYSSGDKSFFKVDGFTLNDLSSVVSKITSSPESIYGINIKAPFTSPETAYVYIDTEGQITITDTLSDFSDGYNSEEEWGAKNWTKI